MGRAAGYDPQQLIGQARDLFWQRGFDAVSVADVEQATGVGRSSIYHAHGNMRGLFDAAVEDYLDTVVRPRLRPLTTDPVVPEAILDFLTGLSAAIGTLASNPDAPQGCLLLVSAAAPIGSDTAVHEVIAGYHRELTDAIGRGVDALLPRTDARVRRRLTRLTVAADIAALSLSRIDPDAAQATLDAAATTLRVHARSEFATQ
ncbi:helix-turn-helix domain-containing protein [Gordonia sp. L191]|uniref:TetR/AcrR family transcriptional regulator n=1 Tax=Gordonia sp. L191 TaxID=2982699 RepID=UPI0024BF6559|nr:TetR/AcrR family transcriptional regulator [Gordonia sp. L191]WHU47971.1 helix-turn-helix domain-containing protein [Gordonia sp. L191]